MRATYEYIEHSSVIFASLAVQPDKESKCIFGFIINEIETH